MKAEKRGEELNMKVGRGAEETAVATRRDGEGNERRGQIKLY